MSSAFSNWTLGCGSWVVAPHSGWSLSWCGRIFPAPVRWRNHPQPGCHLVLYPPVVIIYQIHSDWPLRWNPHSHLSDLPNRGLDRLQYVQDSLARVHTWQHIIPTWISIKILLTYKSLHAIAPGAFQTFSDKRLLSFWVLGAVARTLWKHTPLSAPKCLDCIFEKQLIKTVMYSLKLLTWALWNVLFKSNVLSLLPKNVKLMIHINGVFLTHKPVYELYQRD